MRVSDPAWRVPVATAQPRALHGIIHATRQTGETRHQVGTIKDGGRIRAVQLHGSCRRPDVTATMADAQRGPHTLRLFLDAHQFFP